MSVIKEYINYFRYNATQHPELLHSEESGKYVFEVIDVEESFGDLRTASAEKKMIMRLILPFGNIEENESQDAKVALTGGFIIAAYHGQREQDKIAFEDALAKSFQVALDFIEKMVADAQAKHPLFYHSIRSVKNLNWNAQSRVNVGDGSYSGYLCTFSFQNWFRNCLDAHDDENWKQPTPHNL
jgi:hypothetical protein